MGVTMQQWQVLGFLWGFFFVGGVLGMKSYEELAPAEAGSPVSPLTPIGSRTAVARSGAQRGRRLQAELNRLPVQDLFLNNLKQKGAAADLAGSGIVDVENVLVAPPRYHSNAELQEYLQEYVQRCGHLATLEQFGNSTLGNPLWALEISDHPGEEEAEPAFKFVGNMHGDEPSGRELVLYLAEWLCQNYGVDKQATRIVQQLHVFLVPSLNPDGFDQRNRGNPNGVDLNRDFPDQFFANNNDLAARQAETLALMNWTLSHRFTAGASLHEGAVVANYPWDGSTDQGTHYAEAPDDTAFRHLATAYARGHAHMWNSSDFEGGITNGAAWYPLYGGMQDWNYLHAGCLDITIEVADNKWPPPEQLPSLWSEHKGAMLALLDVLAKSGLHGTVTSALDGSPLLAQIEVEGAGRPIPKFTEVCNLVPAVYRRYSDLSEAYAETI